jgi:hypothetical protein
VAAESVPGEEYAPRIVVLTELSIVRCYVLVGLRVVAVTGSA